MPASDAYGAPGGWWGAAGTSLGAISDIYSFIQNLQRSQQQQKLYDMMANPQKFAAYVAKMFQPMSAAENTAVQRDLGANWATMTGGAPGGAMNQFVADALAKIESQRYQTTAGNAIQTLGGAGGAIGAPAPIGLMGNILKSLMTLKQIQGVGGEKTGITPSGGTGWGGYGAGQSTDMYPAPTTLETPQLPNLGPGGTPPFA